MLLLVLLLTPIYGLPMGGGDIGTFWQVSDFHYDQNYSMIGLRSAYCHAVGRSTNESELGKFGDRECDAPWLLATSAVKAMKKFKADPDFIFWTGDNVPHVPDSQLDMEKVYMTVSNITKLLLDAFPHTPIYPTVGNHDSFPANQITADRSYYEGFLQKCGWNQLIPKDAQDTFLKGGYYATEIQPGLLLIMLNTNMYFTLDKQTAGEDDPAGQLDWLEGSLQIARESQHKVYIVGHVPPGVSPDLWKWMYPKINTRLTGILRRFHDVIQAGIFGHEHTDNFRLIYDENGMSVVPLFMGPAVTPWNEKNNPSMRLYTYHKRNGNLRDYEEYFLDLNAANKEGSAHWLPLYQASQSYALKDLSAKSMQHLLQSVGKSSTSTSFRHYFEHYSTGYVQGKSCNNTCWKSHVCSIKCVEFDCFDHCLASTTVLPHDSKISGHAMTFPFSTHFRPICPSKDPRCKHRPRPVPAYMYSVIYALAGLVFILFFLVTILCCCGPRRHSVFLTQPRYSFVSNSDYEVIR